MIKCTLCKVTSEEGDFIDTAIQDLEAGWFFSPNDRAYCPWCVRDRFNEIEQIEIRK